MNDPVRSYTDKLQPVLMAWTELGSMNSKLRAPFLLSLEELIKDANVTQTLIPYIFSSATQVRRDMARVLAPMVSEATVRNAFLQLLNNDDAATRAIAVRALGCIADDVNVREALLPLLTDSTWGVRATAVTALARFAADVTVSGRLKSLLLDKSFHVRLMMAQSLRSSVHHSSVRTELLLPLLHDPDWPIQEAAIRSVASFASDTLVRSILQRILLSTSSASGHRWGIVPAAIVKVLANTTPDDQLQHKVENLALDPKFPFPEIAIKTLEAWNGSKLVMQERVEQHDVIAGELDSFKVSLDKPECISEMPYVQVAPGSRYFTIETGEAFVVIGHNDALPWPTLHRMYYENDVANARLYFKMLVEHGVNVLRIMLEDCFDASTFFENHCGLPRPESLLFWDNLIALCEEYEIRLLISFWDTYHMQRRWYSHPYSQERSHIEEVSFFCVDPAALATQKQRIKFFIDRWGGSPAIFAYDLLNEIHPCWGGSPEDQYKWVTEIARFTKDYELERWGKRHLVTVSIFGPNLDGGYEDLILNHPELDFASIHAYTNGLMDNPQNTVDCAIGIGTEIKRAFEKMTDQRPLLDTESGPIHLYLDLGRQLPEEVDDEVYHNVSWAHFASGAAGIALRWPFRQPHCLTPGMHRVQRGMARCAAAINWLSFHSRPIDDLIRVLNRDTPTFAEGCPLPVIPFGCASNTQAIVWLLRDLRNVPRDAKLLNLDLLLPALDEGQYVAAFWNTYEGVQVGHFTFELPGDSETASTITLQLPEFGTDLLIVISPAQKYDIIPCDG